MTKSEKNYPFRTDKHIAFVWYMDAKVHYCVRTDIEDTLPLNPYQNKQRGEVIPWGIFIRGDFLPGEFDPGGFLPGGFLTGGGLTVYR